MAVFIARQGKVWPLLPIGTQFVIDSVGTSSWQCPASGNWQIELHGGGGGGGAGGYSRPGSPGGTGGSGGGSGTLETTQLTAGQQVQITIGAGGSGGQPGSPHTPATSGGASSFGSITVQGGGAGTIAGRDGLSGNPGTAYGNLASGKEGNRNNTAQIYGDGGSGGGPRGSLQNGNPGSAGQDGAIILTYLG